MKQDKKDGLLCFIVENVDLPLNSFRSFIVHMDGIDGQNEEKIKQRNLNRLHPSSFSLPLHFYCVIYFGDLENSG